MQHRFGVPVLVITALALVSLRSAAQMTSAAVPAGSASGTWQVTTGVAYAPWTFDLTQTGTTLTGTVRQEGGLRGPARIRDGSVRGSTLSFKADSPSGGRIITFTGIIAGDSMDLTRSVEDPVGELSGAGVFGVSGVMRFTVHHAQARVRSPPPRLSADLSPGASVLWSSTALGFLPGPLISSSRTAS